METHNGPMVLRILQFLRWRLPVIAAPLVASQLPLEMPIMADWAWWDFGLLAISGILILWGFAPEIRKALPITVTIVEDESDRGLPGVLFAVLLLLLLAGYVKLLGEHSVMRLEYERLFEYQQEKIEILEQDIRGCLLFSE